MKAIHISMLLATAVSAETLADFRWEKRLLVVTRSTPAIQKMLAAEKAGLAERDLEVFVLDGPGRPPGAALAKQLREKLKPRKDVPEVLLLGKDGQTTLRWKAADFTPAALYASIDAMPMRQREMKERGVGN